MDKITQTRREGGQKYLDLTLIHPLTLLPVPPHPSDWIQQKPTDGILSGQALGGTGEREKGKRVEMDLVVPTEENSAQPVCECREKHKNIFSCVVIVLWLIHPYWWKKYLSCPCPRSYSIWQLEVWLNSPQELNSLKWEDVPPWSQSKIPKGWYIW